MRKYFLLFSMLLVVSVCIPACGHKKTQEETSTLSHTETKMAQAGTAAAPTTATAHEPKKDDSEPETKARERSATKVTKGSISQSQAKILLLEAFGSVDEASGDENVFIYEKVENIDGVEYYSYRWEDGSGNYLCNAFVRKDGTDILTGIQSDGKWEVGSDFGSSDEEDYDGGDDESYSDDESYDDGFGDIDDEEEETEDAEDATQGETAGIIE